MSIMIGQTKLIQAFSKYTITTLPHTVLLVGQYGCGKHMFVKQLAEKFNLDIVSLDSSITSDELTAYTYSPVAKIYLLDANTISVKQQNKFLKFIEEPHSNSFIIVTAESEALLLPTILNRCLKFNFEPYTLGELKQLPWAPKTADDLVFKLCKTPGQLLDLSDLDKFNALYTFCQSFISKITLANYANFMSIALKINCKDEPTKFDFLSFLKVLSYVAYNYYICDNNELALSIYLLTIKYIPLATNKFLSKESTLIQLLNEIWEALQSWKLKH